MDDCLAIREDMQVATVEPGGLERLTAGDTPDAALLAGHLAACPPCAEELARLHRADAVIRPILSAMASDDLRERVLGQVHDLGREQARRPAAGPADPAATAPDTAAREDRGAARSRRSRPWLAWVAAAAAVLVVGFGGGALVGRGMAPAPADDGARALDMVSRETATIMAAPDAEMVVLRAADGTPRGSLVAAHSAGRIVIMATDLPEPPAGREYRCWVEANGAKAALGHMWITRGVYWWSGKATLPAAPRGSMRFGVTLAATDSQGADPSAQPILTGN